MQNIKNIIFDMGGVFLTLDFNRTADAFHKLGVENFSELFTLQHASPLFQDLEVGKVDPYTFIETFKEANKINSTNEEIIEAWNAMLLDFPLDRLEWLEGISKKYKVYLFSNTNAIHYDAFTDIFRRVTGGNELESYFIKAYFSHTLGLRKPGVESYLKIVENEGLELSETLFIDDTYSNIEGALRAGLQAMHLPLPKTVMELGL